MPHEEQSLDTGIAMTDPSEPPPVDEHRTSHRLPSPLVELWRQRLRYRSQYLRDVLQQLQPESIPESTVGRARLARRLQIPQEGLELHLRLTAASPAPAAQRTQDSPSFVSTAVSRAPDGRVE
ncbi:MAG: hypothetical protein NZ960_07655 [Candidatus Kapabacteria bacterium]|nr:hypothetical protein [Candidatus Kapabacteria bacterium]MDW8011981.1 hypothetical protein [Bacteroidota bacterium]